MSKTRSHTDQAAIFQHAFNEELGALEVTIVGGSLPEFKVDNVSQNITVDNTKMESKMDVLIGTIKDVQSSVVSVWGNSPIVYPTQAQQMIIQKEIQIIEIPRIIIQEKLVEVVREVEVVKEVPGPTKIEVVTVTIDREVVVTKTEYKDLPKLLVAALVLQGLVQIILALLHK